MLQIFSHFCKYFSTVSNILHVEVLATVAAVSCDPYTVGQVAHGFTHGGVITGVDYGHGLVSGYGALGNRAAVYGGYGSYGYPHSAYYGKREAEAEPWTIGQVAAGLPLANAAWEGRLHNPGYIAGVSYGSYGHYPHHAAYYGKREAEADAYTVGQVAAGLPVHNAWATGHPHNVGVVTGVSSAHPALHHGYAAYAAVPYYG